MKIGYQTIIFASEDFTLPEMLDAVVAAGGEGVEFFHRPCDLFLSRSPQGKLEEEVTIHDLKHELELRNLTFLGLAGGTLRERIEFCLGREINTVPSNSHPVLSPLYLYVEDIDAKDPVYIEGFRLGFRFALHPHFYMKVEKMSDIRLSHRYSLPGLYWLPDTAHLYLAGDDPVEEISLIPENRLIAVHFKDWDESFGRAYSSYAEGFTNLGQGDVPLEESLQALIDRQFEGWLVIEQDYPRPSIELSLQAAAAWLVTHGLTSEESIKDPPARRRQTEPDPKILALAELYNQAKFEDLDARHPVGPYPTLAKALRSAFGVELATLWAWNSNRQVATLLAAHPKNEVLQGLGMTHGGAGILLQSVSSRSPRTTDIQRTEPTSEGDLHWQALSAALDAPFLTTIPIYLTHNPNQTPYVVALISKTKPRDVVERFTSIRTLVNRVSEATNHRRKGYLAGRVSFLAKRSTSLAQFLKDVQELIVHQLSCQAAAIFLENVSREHLLAATPGIRWNGWVRPGHHYYERSDAGRHPTAECWVHGRTVFIQGALPPSSSQDWKSKNTIVSESGPSQSNETEDLRQDVLIVPIRAASLDEASHYSRTSVVGVIRIRNKFRSDPYRAPFTDDDAACLTVIGEAAATAIGPMLDFERQKRKMALMMHELHQPINVLNALIDQIAAGQQRLPQLLADAGVTASAINNPRLRLQTKNLLDYAEDALSWFHLMSRQVNLVRILEASDLQEIMEIDQWYLMADVIAPMKPQFIHELQRRKLSIRGLTYSDFKEVDKLYFDRNLMQQVFFNLISNGIKYAFQKQPESFRIHIEAEEERDAYRIDCIDYGAGIPDGYEELIFKEGVRSPGAIASGEKGLGLGLWVVKKIVEAHGGDIKVRSNYRPTTISVYLPKSLKNMPPRRRVRTENKPL